MTPPAGLGRDRPGLSGRSARTREHTIARDGTLTRLASAGIAAVALARSLAALGSGAHRQAPAPSLAVAPAPDPAESHPSPRTDPNAREDQHPAEARRLARQPGRGRRADQPSDLPVLAWRDIAKRVRTEVEDDNIALLSAGVAFYALLSLFPALVAVVSIYGLLTDPADVGRQLQDLTRTLPREAATLVVDQMQTIAASSSSSLGFSVVTGIVAALWSASSGMKWLLHALSLTYDEREGRSFLRLRGTALALTVAAAAGLLVSLGLIAALPALSRALGLGTTGRIVAAVVRWPALGALVVTGLAVLYRYGPDRERAKWRWVSWGSALGAVVWLGASAAFAGYAAVAGSFDDSYGPIAGVVVTMLWLYLTVFSVLVGAEVNAEMEHQTARDTTAGPARPLGERGATMADEVGEPHDAGLRTGP